jgi:CHAD domain-containing protein
MTPFTLVSPPAPETEGISLPTLLGEAGLREDPGESGRRLEVYVDTPCGRLTRDGWRLHHRPDEALWILERDGEVTASQSGPAARMLPPGPVADALASVSFDGGLIPQLVVRRRLRVFGPDRADEPAADAPDPAAPSAEGRPGPADATDAPGLTGRVQLEEYVFVDPHDERETTGPRVLILSGRDETAPGWELGRFILNRIAGSKAATVDVLAEGLAALGLPLPGVPTPAALQPGAEDSLAEVLAKILREQAGRIRGFRRGTVLDLDPEYLHQLRVATRRARAAIRFFRPWLEERPAREVSAGLGEIGRVLGRVRDMDVLTEPFARDLNRAGVQPEVARRILHAFYLRRRAGLEAVVKLLESPRFAEVVSALEQLEAVPGLAMEPAAAQAPPLLKTAARKLKKWRRRPVESLSENDLHRIRIAVKRLRYLAEFFAPYGGADFPEAVRALVPYQDCLGEAQDARVAVDYLRGLAEFRSADGRPDVDEIFAIGELIRRQEKRKLRRRAQFRTLWKEFPARNRRLRKAL